MIRMDLQMRQNETEENNQKVSRYRTYATVSIYEVAGTRE
jgi:hypothetical protein